METLPEKIAEWSETINAASLELKMVRTWVGKVGASREPFAVALDEAEGERDAAQDELTAMKEALALLARVVGQLDRPGRSTLAQAVRLLCEVDWQTRTDALAGEAQRLRRLRLQLPGGAN